MDEISLIKVVSALLYPMGLLLLAAVFGLVFRWCGWRKLSWLCSFGFFVVLGLTSNPKVASWMVASLESQYPQKALANIAPHDAIVVLGGGLRIPSAPAHHVQLSHGSDRFWYATKLYRAGKARKIIIAGGNVYSQKGLEGEAYYASLLLQEWGVPVAAIVVESGSRTTRQNLDNVTTLLEQEGVKSVLLVTSALHMPRAYELFGRLPIIITPATADVLIRDYDAPRVFDWIPSARAMQLSTMALHEVYGRWFNQISRWWKALISSF